MKNTGSRKSIIIAEIIIVVVAVAVLLLPQIIGGTENLRESAVYTSADELNGKTLGVITGDVTEYYTHKLFPDSPLHQFNGEAEMLLSLAQGKLDGILYYNNSSTILIMEEYPSIRKLPEVVTTISCSFATARNEKGYALADEYNAFTKTIKASGEYDELSNKWMSEDFEEQRIENYVYTGEKGTLSAATMSGMMPYTYKNDEGWQGFYNDLFCNFCAKSGYIPEINDVPFNSQIAGLVSGKYDFLSFGVSYTEERAEQINFTEAVSGFPLAMMVYDGKQSGSSEFSDLDGTAEGGSSKVEVFFKEIAESFEKNFIRENRWKMMADGLLVTVLLAVLSAVFGTLLGALICLMRRSEKSFITGFARLYIKLFQGTPIVVLLLVLYYVVFGSTDINAFFVCVVGFSLDFSAYVSEIIRSGIEAVPGGQLRAAYALGYGRVRAFREIVLPQAIRHILPVYRGQLVAMVKMTSIAGYISVEDLTKVSDIIRSRTYEAFFPLITTAIIYFALANVLTLLLKAVQVRIDPNNKKRNLKRVK